MKGAETENSVMIQSSHSTTHNLRGTILRSVSNLVILNGLSESDLFYFEGLKTNSALLYCMKDCDNQMFESKTYLTATKRMKRICAACKLKCHVDNKHKFKYVLVHTFKKE